VSSWGTALRIARRDAIKHKGRSLLVMALIALPVLATVTADVVIRSGIATHAETVQSQLAGADAWIMAPAGVTGFVQQDNYFASPPISGQGTVTRDGQQVSIDVSGFPARPAGAVLPLLPAGSQITRWRHVTAVPLQAPSGRYVSVAADLLDITSTASGDRYSVITGAAPETAGQLAVTEHLAARLSLAVGEQVYAGAPARDFTITAIVRPAATGGGIPPGVFDAVVAMPGDLAFVDETGSSNGPRYLVESPERITSAMVARLNGQGIGVFSRADAMGWPVPISADPGVPMFLVLAAVAVAVVMALLQVVFLAGPAFAIGARRMRRQLGLLAATGGTGRHLRAIVLGTGVVLGAGAAILGLLAGVGLGLVLRVLLMGWVPGYHSLGVHLHVAELVGIAAVGFVSAVLAALAPAIRAGRSTPLSLLGRQPPGSGPLRWWSLAGAIMAAAGLAVTVWAGTGSVSKDALVGATRDRGVGLAVGVALVEVGLLLTVPLLVRWCSRLGARLPISGRLALRDADRHRSRTAPGIAAVTAGATLAVLAAVMYSSSGAHAQQHYRAGLPVGDVAVRLGDPDATSAAGRTPDVAVAKAVIGSQWPGARSVAYQTVNAQQEITEVVTSGGVTQSRFTQRGLILPPANICPYTEVVGHSSTYPGDGNALIVSTVQQQTPTVEQATEAATDWRCYGRSYSNLTAEQAHVHSWSYSDGNYVTSSVQMPAIVAGGPELRRQLTGVPDPAADAALTAGGAVVLDRTYLAADGTISSGVQNGDQGPDGPVTTDIRTVPAVLGAWSPTPLGVILSPQAARALGWTLQSGGLIVNPGTAVDQAQAQDLAEAVEAATGSPASATVETEKPANAGASTHSTMTILLIILGFLIAGTIVVVTALGLADARADLATLAAVGAPPRVRRLITGWTAGLVTLLGCLLGGAIGLVPAWGLLRLIQIINAPFGDPIIVPWVVLVPLLIAIPLAAFVIGTLMPRSKLPMVARIE
jgi:putative ABC transport system permease protein